MTKLYAQPYDISARGFYFDTAEEYESKAARNRNDFGGLVEEYEIQFIDGDEIDADLFRALSVSQANLPAFFNSCDEWDDQDKIKVIVAVGQAGYRFDLGRDDPDRLDVDLYECDSLRDLAMQFVDEGLFGESPPAIENYIDYDAIAYDLATDYGMVTLSTASYAYRLC